MDKQKTIISHIDKIVKWRIGDLNPSPWPCKDPALPNELIPLASRTGLEPVTNCLEGRCSIQLSYRDKDGLIEVVIPRQP
jgi:hypothetical protein